MHTTTRAWFTTSLLLLVGAALLQTATLIGVRLVWAALVHRRCAELCPTHAIEGRAGKASIVRAEDCTFCEICERYGPEEAIDRPLTIVFAPTPPLARRHAGGDTRHPE